MGSFDVGSQTPNDEQKASHVGDKYEVPAYEPHSSFSALKDRIRFHYDTASDYYYSLWGEHIHHGYFKSDTDTKETAQINLIKLLQEISSLEPKSSVLDVGCGIGGTSRYLAQNNGCTVTGITISGRQVEIANRLSTASSTNDSTSSNPNDKETHNSIPQGTQGGSVAFIELDAEKMGAFFPSSSFDVVWISEAMSHLPDKQLFFNNAAAVLKQGGKLVVADWFKAEDLTAGEEDADINLIEDGMLLPPLHTQQCYVTLAQKADLKIFHEPLDISKDVSKTWDISWSLISSPSLWAFALSQGRDGLAFLQAFRAMRRGYANGSFRYAVMIFQK